jgi:hypothetical protein
MNLEARRASTAFLAALAIGAGVLASGGCGQDKAAGPKRVPLNVQVQGIGGASQRFLAAAGLAPALSADTIPVTFTRARRGVRDVRFVLPDGDDHWGEDDTLGLGEGDSTGADGDDDGGGQVRFRGPWVIDLLAGDAQSLGTQMVPAGVYHKVMGHLQSLGSGDPLAGDYPDLVGSTVLLEGEIAGEGGGHFLYATRIDTEFIIHGSFAVVGDTPVTSFVVFDLSAFLRGHDGLFLDPRNGDHDLAIRQAIRHAVKVGIDHDHDGEPDDDMAEAD